MVYAIFDLELTEPLPELRLDHQAGVALTVRRKGRVLGFLIKSLPSVAILDRTEVARWIAAEVGTRWVAESLREELWASDSLNSGNGLPSLTVAICTRDRPSCLHRCLQSLLELRRRVDSPQPQWEALVVDNASSDGQTKQVVAQFPDVRYVSEVRRGLNFARNRAVRDAGGELLAFLDDDVVVDRFWLQGLREAWLANPDAAAFTGQVLPVELETESQILFERRGGFRHGFEQVRYTQSVPTGAEGFLYPCRTGIFGVGCNMAFRRQILQEIGGFDEALDTGSPLPGGGDHDIFYRIIRAGYPLIYEPGFLVFHQHRRTMEQLRQQYWTWGLSTMAFASKAHHWDRPLRSRWQRMVIDYLIYYVREVVAATLGRRSLPARFYFWELLGAVVGLCGEYQRSKRRVVQIRERHP